MSRYTVLDSRVVTLPRCFEAFEHVEKRYGQRNCLWVLLEIGDRKLWVGATHLEVRGNPGCRARQMKHLLERMPGSGKGGYLLAGDFNTNGFRRGTLWRALISALRLVGNPPNRVKQQLLHPERGAEPLFDVVKRSGFLWEGLNSGQATACAAVSGLDEADFLPRALSRLLEKRLEPYGGQLHFKLDWLFGKNIRALRRHEVTDAATGVASLDPARLATEWSGANRISDHTPIFADIRA